MLNFRLLSHPLNWITVWLMVLIAGTFGHLLLTLFDQEPATAANPAGAALPAGLTAQAVPTDMPDGLMDAQIVSGQASYEAMMEYGTTYWGSTAEQIY